MPKNDGLVLEVLRKIIELVSMVSVTSTPVPAARRPVQLEDAYVAAAGFAPTGAGVQSIVTPNPPFAGAELLQATPPFSATTFPIYPEAILVAAVYGVTVLPAMRFVTSEHWGLAWPPPMVLFAGSVAHRVTW